MTSTNRSCPVRRVPSLRWLAVPIIALVMGFSTATGAAAAPLASPASPNLVTVSRSSVTLGQTADTAKPVKYYVVQPAYEGKPEFLFSIAARYLGKGDRWPEIFALNEGRLQPDGGKLVKAEVITAGWYLVLPEDAQGAEVQSGALPAAATGADETPAESSGSPVLWVAGGLALLAGLVLIAYGVMVMRRRESSPATPVRAGRPQPPTKPEKAAPAKRWPGRPRGAAGEPQPRSFDAAAAWTVDRALRSLAGLAFAAGRALPSFYAVSLDGDRLRLRLAVPDHEPPAPWDADEAGLGWSAPLRDLQAVPLDDRVAAPSPRLVTLGMDGGTRVLLDLGQATGVIAVDGPSAGVRALLQGWVAELAATPWADQVRVIVAGLDAPPAEADSANRVQVVNGAHEALAAVGSAAVGWSGGGAVAGVLRGGTADSSGPGVLVLAAGARGADLEQVQALAGRPDAGWAVIYVGRVPAARWRFTLSAGGQLDTGVLGITVQATESTARVPIGR